MLAMLTMNFNDFSHNIFPNFYFEETFCFKLKELISFIRTPVKIITIW